MAFTAVVAIAGGAEVTAGLVLAAVAEVGTAMTVVGALTGSKDLMKIGGAMALVGGVGGMINGAMGGAAAAGADGAAGTVANEAASAGDYVNAADAMSDAATAGSQSSGIIGSATAPPGVGADLASNTAAQAPGQQMAQEMATTGPVQSVAPTGNAAQGITQQAPEVQGAVAPSGPAGAQAPTTPFDRNGSDVMSDTFDATGSKGAGGFGGAGAPVDSGSFFNKFSDWATKNKTLFSSGLQLAGGALNGMNQRQMWDQKMALEQQRLGQTSYGSQVGVWAPTATPGIIGGAR